MDNTTEADRKRDLTRKRLLELGCDTNIIPTITSYCPEQEIEVWEWLCACMARRRKKYKDMKIWSTRTLQISLGTIFTGTEAMVRTHHIVDILNNFRLNGLPNASHIKVKPSNLLLTGRLVHEFLPEPSAK